jgi:tRNA(Ile2) C34 agmatinyltransferase TiaS
MTKFIGLTLFVKKNNSKIKVKKLKPCQDCGIMIKSNGKRCKACSEDNRVERIRMASKSYKKDFSL